MFDPSLLFSFLMPRFVVLFVLSIACGRVQFGNVLPDEYTEKTDIPASWHTQTFPRTIYD